MLSSRSSKRLIQAIADQRSARELIDAVNQGSAGASQDAFCIPAVIVATSVSATVDFAALAVGDKLIHIPAVAGNSAFEAIVTAGTKPSAAVVGDLYVVLRAFASPAASSEKL